MIAKLLNVEKVYKDNIDIFIIIFTLATRCNNVRLQVLEPGKILINGREIHHFEVGELSFNSIDLSSVHYTQ
jgi:hypothetical protein